MKNIIISRQNLGERIDKFLMRELFSNGEISRGEIIRLINSGKVLVNQKETKPSYILKENDELCILDIIQKEKKLKANQNIKIEIIFEDKNIIVINKPAGLSVHGVDFEKDDTLVSALIGKFPEIRSVGEDLLRPGIVHRLDKDTSGVMVIARNQKTFEELKRKFKSREIKKKYVAWVHGHIDPREGVIDKPIARASTYKKQVIAGKKTETKIRGAITEYQVLKSVGDFDLVEARPKTGRMHQIRVHLFSIGHPIVGDKLYKLKKRPSVPGVKRQLLHAKELDFELFGQKHEFQSAIPKDFKNML
ncbi:MAG: RluA family pseudouridine synthase [Patescibacteria group bacterium]